MLRAEHPDTLGSINNLAQVLGRRGKHDEAEAIHRQTLAAKEKVLREEHGSTLANVYCLVRLLGNQHRFEEATRLFEKACLELLN
jgi:hypothetical protein